MDSFLIAWDPRPRDIAADPAATLSLDRDRWQARGARFESYRDEIGGMTAVATASARHRDSAIQFGVLDYGQDTSYLVVAGSYAENAADVDAVVQALLADGTITSSDVLERLPSEAQPGTAPGGAAGNDHRSADTAGPSEEDETRTGHLGSTLGPPDRSAKGFVCYAHADTPLVERFLSLMAVRGASLREFRTDQWWDRRILVGESWRDELANLYEAYDFGLLCITPRYLASSYVTDVELPALLRQGVTIPVALEPLGPVGAETHALRDLVAFRYRRSSSNKPRAFGECSGASASGFCDALVVTMAERLRSRAAV